jgi:hypothetical protein
MAGRQAPALSQHTVGIATQCRSQPSSAVIALRYASSSFVRSSGALNIG